MADFKLILERKENKFERIINEHLAQGYRLINGAYSGTRWAGFLLKE